MSPVSSATPMNLSGVTIPLAGVSPSHQGLMAQNCSIIEGDDRLIVHVEVPVGDGLA